MRKDSVKVSLEIDRNTDLEELMANLSLIKKLVTDLGEGLEMNDLTELLAYNGLAGRRKEEKRIETS